MTQAAAVANDDLCVEDPIDMVLGWHDGDTRPTIAKLLEDCQHLRRQRALLEGIASHGMTRGWTPAYHRH